MSAVTYPPATIIPNKIKTIGFIGTGSSARLEAIIRIMIPPIAPETIQRNPSSMVVII